MLDQLGLHGLDAHHAPLDDELVAGGQAAVEVVLDEVLERAGEGQVDGGERVEAELGAPVRVEHREVLEALLTLMLLQEEREERHDLLKQKIIDYGLNVDDYWWYLQLRQYGSVPHAGFGAGFERLVLFATGMENIRDVIPFPRYPGHADF